ncbi:unnamed protein product [Paramecium octaurelia]|uniref:Ubiquitin-like protease family profile domain-containing protein n=1 Tax=Paramecium octaurelia TaxID=43137 RepID=A0A8S1V1Q6_PAROT|nr:unnamed protein product [Paramecium octaurelia]
MGCLYGYFMKQKQPESSNQLESQQKESKEIDQNEQAEISNNSSQETYKRWQMDCNKFKYDLIKLNKDSYFYVLLFVNIQFYHYQRDIITKEVNQYEVDGFLYKTEYDEDFNPKYILQEGRFLINLQRGTFELNGEGVEFLGKSKFRKHEGKFQNGRFISKQQNIIISQNENQPRKINNQKKIIIKDAATGLQINKQQQQNRYQRNHNQDVWCKYNQTFSNNDLNILKNKGWMTSSIIDGYVLYLNFESEKQYFQLQETERKNVQRVLFLPSSLTTNFGKNFTYDKVRKLLEQELLQYSQMNLSIQLIYKKVGIPINQNNFHWYFLLIEFDTKVEIFDSTQNSITISGHADKLIKTLQEVLQIKCKTIVNSKESGKQRNDYSCGYHVCNYMKFVQQAQFNNNNRRYDYQENKIIQILQELIDKQTK